MIIFYAFILLLVSSFCLDGEGLTIDRAEYLKNLSLVREYKKNMSTPMKEYYLPRKRFIDRQSVNPISFPYNQLHILSRGVYLRSKYYPTNSREIKKLEVFLNKADDFQLNRYFSDFEEIYLKSNAHRSIQHIRETAERDERWRLKNDPIFAKYISHRATPPERKFYNQNKFLFYGELTGNQLIAFLKTESKGSFIQTISMRDSNESNFSR
jgi:hypothetical protein